MAPGTEVASLAAAIEAVEHLKARKGAFRIALIPPEVLHALNDGLIAVSYTHLTLPTKA